MRERVTTACQLSSEHLSPWFEAFSPLFASDDAMPTRVISLERLKRAKISGLRLRCHFPREHC
jgi:hypothetical protein